MTNRLHSRFFAGAAALVAAALLLAAPARAEKDAATGGAPAQKTAKMPAAKPAAKAADKKPAAKPLPCARASYPDDPICFNEPDEHTPPMASSSAGLPSGNNNRPKWHPTDDDKLSVGVDWRANNEQTGPKWGIESNLNGARAITPNGSSAATPDTRGALGLDYKF